MYPMIYVAPDFWYSMFAYSVELAGPVFIKLAQYVSTRGDLFSNELAEKFSHLREHCRTHSIEETRDLFRESFGEDINDVFKFKKEPIASGSIGQVYKATKDCEDYVIKVRHPGVKEMIDKDLTLVFGAAETISMIPGSGIAEFPTTVTEFKKVLYEQTDLRKEGDNLR